MTTRPYELLIRFAVDGTVAGAHTRLIATVAGRDYELDPVPLSESDEAFADFVALFNTAVLSERDSLKAELVVANELIEQLQRQLPWDRRIIDPAAFAKRVTSDEMLKLFAADDANVRSIAEMLKAYTANKWQVELDSTELVGAIDYLVQTGFITSGRAKELLADSAQQEAYQVN